MTDLTLSRVRARAGAGGGGHGRGRAGPGRRVRGRGPQAAAGTGPGGVRERGWRGPGAHFPAFRHARPVEVGGRGAERARRAAGRGGGPGAPGGVTNSPAAARAASLRRTSTTRQPFETAGRQGRRPEGPFAPQERCGPAPGFWGLGTVMGPRVEWEPFLLPVLRGALSAGFLGSAPGISRERARCTALLVTEEGPGVRRERGKRRERWGDC